MKKLLCNTFPHKMIVNFDVLGTSMKNWIRRKIRRTNIITPKNRWLLLRDSQLSQQRLYPNELNHGIGNRLILCFSATPRYYGLLARTPGDQVATKEDNIAPLVDRLSSRLPAQSASENAERALDEADRRCKPYETVW